MPTVSRKTLVDILQKELGLSVSQADFLLRDFFDVITASLAEGQDVKISGFGNFILRDKKARPGRNVTVNESVTVLPRRVVAFKAGAKAKSLVKAKTPDLVKRLGLE